MYSPKLTFIVACNSYLSFLVGSQINVFLYCYLGIILYNFRLYFYCLIIHVFDLKFFKYRIPLKEYACIKTQNFKYKFFQKKLLSMRTAYPYLEINILKFRSQIDLLNHIQFQNSISIS